MTIEYLAGNEQRNAIYDLQTANGVPLDHQGVVENSVFDWQSLNSTGIWSILM